MKEGCIIDTDVCISLMKRDKRVLGFVRELELTDLSLTFMTVSELFYGSYNAQRRACHQELTKEFVRRFEILFPNFNSCEQFGIIKASLIKEGRLIPDVDLLIASIAISHDRVLLTHNKKHFERLSPYGLTLL